VQIGNKDSCGKYNKKFFQIPLNMIAHWKFFFCWLEIPRWPLQWDNLIGNPKMATTMRQFDWKSKMATTMRQSDWKSKMASTMRQFDWKSQDGHYNETIWLEIPRWPLQWDNLIGNPKMAITMRQSDWKSQDVHYNETVWLEIQDGHYNEIIMKLWYEYEWKSENLEWR
jgi:hypothetical protein